MQSNRKIHFIIARILQGIVALVLLSAAYLKAFDPPSFAMQIAEYGIFPNLAGVAAWCFLVAEFLIAAGLLLNLFPRVWNIAAITLLLVFIGVTVFAMETGSLENCGCFGNLLHRPPSQVIIEDALMIVALAYATIVLWNGGTQHVKPKVIITVLFTALSMMTAVFSGSLPVDNLVTDLRPGEKPAPWLSQNLGFDLAEGNHLVFLVSMVAPDFPDIANRVSTLVQNLPPNVTPVVLIVDPSEELIKLSFQYGISCPAAWVDPKAARRLYRKLPRSFLVKDGTITNVWQGVAPLPDLTRALSGSATP